MLKVLFEKITEEIAKLFISIFVDKVKKNKKLILFFAVILIFLFILFKPIVETLIPTPTPTPAVQSQLSNLQIKQDDTDIRILHLQWDDVPGLEYVVNINRIDSSGRSTEAEMNSERVSSTYKCFYKALPRTSYSISVYEPISGKQLTETIEVTKAPEYSRFNAYCHGGTMYWIDRADLAKGQDAMASNTTRKMYSNISVKKFAETLVEYDFYGVSTFTYEQASEAHQVNILYILRGPDGKVVSIEESRQLEGASSNHTWKWEYSLKPLIQKMTGTNTLTLAGDYMYEVYFDGCRVSREEFTLSD